MHTSIEALTRDWGRVEDVNLYLDRCQHDTPTDVVSRVWTLVKARRSKISKVVDFGAGDGRFAIGGEYERYIGYEIDPQRGRNLQLPSGARIIHSCAFSSSITDAGLCLGNPPFVRNQDLPRDWRKRAAGVIEERTGVTVSGLANAWQYFALLALASTTPDGLVALVMPFEWVSRPSARALRDFVAHNKWDVAVYRLHDETFNHVLTTSSITLIDKNSNDGLWEYFEDRGNTAFRSMPSPTGTQSGLIYYSRGSRDRKVFARRGLSPGTQEVLTLTEQERVDSNLHIRRDVVRCVTSLRAMSGTCRTLTRAVFDKKYRDSGAKCWLIRTDRSPTSRLKKYLESVPEEKRNTSTCDVRDEWWRFTLPESPSILVASGFNGARPKAVRNAIGAIAVGSVSGVFGLTAQQARELTNALHVARFRSRIVAHSNGLRKVEIGQLETFLARHFRRGRSRASRS